MTRASAVAAVPAYLSAVRINLAGASVAPEGVSLGCSPALVGYIFGLFGSLDPAASAVSANLAQLGTWTPSTTPGGTPQAPPGQPAVDGWPSIYAVRLTPGSVTGNLIASAELSALATTPTSLTFATAGIGGAALRVGDFPASPISVPGSQTRIMLDATATLATAADLWVGDGDLAGYQDTSSTSWTMALGAKTFTVTAGKSFQVGNAIRLSFSSTVYADATVISYSGTTLEVDAYQLYGTPGTHAAWVLNFTSAPPGYRYVQRLHGNGGSVLIGEGTAVPSGLYLVTTPVSGSPVTLYAQGTATDAAPAGGVASSVVNAGVAAVTGGTGVDVEATTGDANVTAADSVAVQAGTGDVVLSSSAADMTCSGRDRRSTFTRDCAETFGGSVSVSCVGAYAAGSTGGNYTAGSTAPAALTLIRAPLGDVEINGGTGVDLVTGGGVLLTLDPATGVSVDGAGLGVEIVNTVAGGGTYLSAPPQIGWWGNVTSASGVGSGGTKYMTSSGSGSLSTGALAGVASTSAGTISRLAWAFKGDVLNVGAQTVTLLVERSTDGGATWAAVAGATSGAQASNSAAPLTGVVLFAPVTRNAGDQFRGIVVISADLTAAVTFLSLAAS